MSEDRFQTVFRKAANYVAHNYVHTLIIDLSGLTSLGDYEMEEVIKLQSILSLLRAEMQLSGVTPEMAMQAVNVQDYRRTNIQSATSVKEILTRLLTCDH
ncbi:hypothetical protein [Geomicrobium sp. JCM 19038]|uniref:hypothetical protein n=1 Tax=Geomicrobium sp. JCM 19038 TaxID=1460635 RepID=UPI00045F3EB4|nr:hypothetical protein [Geomicrobium sp. JCM 19038]GAK08012.1 hypothetical protein JCM19038_1775 [Geomicrobium sp. JCM 19038]